MYLLFQGKDPENMEASIINRIFLAALPIRDLR